MKKISDEKIKIVDKVYRQIKELGMNVETPEMEENGEMFEYTFFFPQQRKRFGGIIYLELDEQPEDFFMDDFHFYRSMGEEFTIEKVLNLL